MFKPVHQTHQYSLCIHHRTTLSAGTHGCWGSAAPGGSVEVYDSSSRQTDRGNQHDHHNEQLWGCTVRWHTETAHVNTAPLLHHHNRFTGTLHLYHQYTYLFCLLKPKKTRNSPQLVSSVPSKQSLSPSQRKVSGMQRLLLSQ